MKLKILLASGLLLSCMSVMSQKIWVVEQDSGVKPSNSSFNQEQLQVAEFLRRQYRAIPYEKFKGSIVRSYQYFRYCSQTLIISPDDTLATVALASGLLYPNVFAGVRISDCSQDGNERTNGRSTFGGLGVSDSLTITNFQRVLIPPPQNGTRTYSLRLSKRGLSNPQVCILVVDNSEASEGLSDAEYLRSGRLLFFEAAWIVI